MRGSEDTSGLYEASGLREIFENPELDKEIEEAKKKKEEDFWNDIEPKESPWKDIENEKDIFDEPKIEENEIDPFWLT
jgi:hypothetical protein